MKKLVNDVDDLLMDSLRGFVKAHRDLVTLNEQPAFIARSENVSQGKVALVSGGGAGHEPLHAGLVGKGMLDAACPGQIFTSPTPDQMMAAAEQVDNGAGVLFIVKNYACDVMNFEIATEMFDGESASVLVCDDVSLPADHSTGRRGVAGTLIVEKIVGAAAEMGATLSECQTLGERVNKATASIGVALTSCTVPALGKPTFEIIEEEMEFGVGIHGERGRETVALKSASEIVTDLASVIETELSITAGQKVLLHINGFGGTPLIELYAVYDLATKYWQARGVEVVRSLVGNYTTSLDMAGCSMTVTLMDKQFIELWDAPVDTASLRW